MIKSSEKDDITKFSKPQEKEPPRETRLNHRGKKKPTKPPKNIIIIKMAG
jgi:hypothetical protein